MTMGPLEPFASVLSGVNYLRATIPSGNAYREVIPASNTSALVPLFGAGAGVTWTFWARYFVCAEAAAFVTQPDELLYIEDNNSMGRLVGRTGAPSIRIGSSVGITLQ